MYVASAFAFTPAPIISDANVCRASCIPIGASPAVRHALSARPFTCHKNRTASQSSGPKTSPAERPARSLGRDQMDVYSAVLIAN